MRISSILLSVFIGSPPDSCQLACPGAFARIRASFLEEAEKLEQLHFSGFLSYAHRFPYPFVYLQYNSEKRGKQINREYNLPARENNRIRNHRQDCLRSRSFPARENSRLSSRKPTKKSPQKSQGLIERLNAPASDFNAPDCETPPYPEVLIFSSCRPAVHHGEMKPRHSPSSARDFSPASSISLHFR